MQDEDSPRPTSNGMEERLQRVEHELKAISERNARVEADKAWETSPFRMFAIAAFTYGAATLVLYLIGAENIFFGALVPVLGFILSVQSLPTLKRWWIRHFFMK